MIFFFLQREHTPNTLICWKHSTDCMNSLATMNYRYRLVSFSFSSTQHDKNTHARFIIHSLSTRQNETTNSNERTNWTELSKAPYDRELCCLFRACRHILGTRIHFVICCAACGFSMFTPFDGVVELNLPKKWQRQQKTYQTKSALPWLCHYLNWLCYCEHLFLFCVLIDSGVDLRFCMESMRICLKHKCINVWHFFNSTTVMLTDTRCAHTNTFVEVTLERRHAYTYQSQRKSRYCHCYSLSFDFYANWTHSCSSTASFQRFAVFLYFFLLNGMHNRLYLHIIFFFKFLWTINKIRKFGTINSFRNGARFLTLKTSFEWRNVIVEIALMQHLVPANGVQTHAHTFTTRKWAPNVGVNTIHNWAVQSD